MPGEPDALLAELRALELEIHHPGVPCTRERLERLLHPDFHEVGRSGRAYDRETVLRFLATRTAMPPVASGGFRVSRVDARTALLEFRSEELAADGSRRNAALRASIWVLGEGGWQLLYHHATPAAD